jgi:hypothetical protein
VTGLRCDPELPLPPAAQPQLTTDTLDPAHSNAHPVSGEIPLRPPRWPSASTSKISAGRHLRRPAQHPKRIFQSHRLHHRAPCSDSWTKHAVAFFKMSHSIRTRAGSCLTRDAAASSSVSGRWRLPIPSSFPALNNRSQFSRLDLGNVNRSAASPADRPPSVTSRTASKRNSFVYLPHGAFFILTLPLIGYLKLRCPFYPTYS